MPAAKPSLPPRWATEPMSVAEAFKLILAPRRVAALPKSKLFCSIKAQRGAPAGHDRAGFFDVNLVRRRHDATVAGEISQRLLQVLRFDALDQPALTAAN